MRGAASKQPKKNRKLCARREDAIYNMIIYAYAYDNIRRVLCALRGVEHPGSRSWDRVAFSIPGTARKSQRVEKKYAGLVRRPCQFREWYTSYELKKAKESPVGDESACEARTTTIDDLEMARDRNMATEGDGRS